MTDYLSLAGIRCSEDGCLASMSWMGLPTDPALAEVAKRAGWTVFEGRGWLCPHHLRALAADEGGER